MKKIGDIMSYTKLTIGTVASTLTLLGSLPAIAEGAQDIEHLIVSGTRSEQHSVEIPASIQVLTAEQIKLSGAPNLVQVLNAQPGIQINDAIGNQGRGASISMRGFGANSANNVLVMVDGRKLNNPTLAGPDLASIAIKDIERIEIIQGSAGTLYGDQATGGVINVITKKAAELSGFIEAAVGTDSYESYQGAVSQAFDNGLSFRLSGEKSEADNYRDNNDAEYSNVLANVGFENELFSVFVEGQTVDDDLRMPGSLTTADVRDDRKQTFSPDDFSDRDTDTYRFGGSINMSDDWALLAEYSKRDEDSEGFLWGGNFTSSTDVDTFEPRITGEIDTANGPLLITAGIDLEDTDYESSLTFSDVSQEAEDYYAQVISPLSQSIKMTLGARYSDFESKDNISKDKFEDDLTVYQAGLAYHFNEQSRVFIRRDESFRWANVDENGFTMPTVDFLKPQESTSWELGVETRIDSVFLSALIYDMEIDNEIIYDPTAVGPGSPLFDGANINIDESQRTGIVLNSIWQATDSINVQLNYSYTDAEISSGTFDGNTVPFVAESTANLVISYQLNGNWSFYADAQYTGEMYPVGDEANDSDEIDDYTVVNANVRWDFRDFYANLRMNNILGKEYSGFSGGVAPFDYNYPAPEETFQFALGYNF